MNVLQKRELEIILLLSPKDIFLKDVRPQHFAKSLFLTLRIDFQLFLMRHTCYDFLMRNLMEQGMTNVHKGGNNLLRSRFTACDLLLSLLRTQWVQLFQLFPLRHTMHNGANF